ncbi:MAG: family 20 glycosylhydrolase [Clostridia bacterium]|nr:family 20 glycosylhydrolase [Clostridia bacterium]
MYIVPQPKELKSGDGILCAYEYDVVLDKHCENNIFIAAKDLKNVMIENGFTNTKIVKPLTKRENCIFLTFEEKGGQGYSLNVNEKGIIVNGESQRGLFYGIQSLKQIIMQSGINVPYLEINDSPDMKERGYYLDISRGRVPTVEGIKKFIDKAAFYKYTDFQLYIEHTFAWEGFEEIYTHQGYLTAEEILEIDAYCRERYIDLVPSFALFGHLFNLLQSKSYNKYCELENHKMIKHNYRERMEHHTIDLSNPESFELLKRMLDQVIPLFTSNKFNICCDETVDLGIGRAKEMADKIGKGQMYVNHINALYKYLHDEMGKTIMFWGDIVGNYFLDIMGDCSDVVTQLPEDIICLLWEYNHPMREKRYVTIMENRLTKCVCPWTACASRFIPLYHGTGYVGYDNIDEMARFGKKNGVDRMLVTDWGDSGHVCHAELRFPLLALGGAKSWNNDSLDGFCEFDRYISQIEYGNPEVLALLKEVSEVSKLFQWGNLISEYNNCVASVDINAPKCEKKPPTKKMKEAYSKLEELEIKIASCKMNESRDAVITAVKGTRLVIAIKLAEKYPVMDNFVLANKIEQWFEEFALVWRKDNKESELNRMYEFLEIYCTELRE